MISQGLQKLANRITLAVVEFINDKTINRKNVDIRVLKVKSPMIKKLSKDVDDELEITIKFYVQYRKIIHRQE